jgi:hypothetical protein
LIGAVAAVLFRGFFNFSLGRASFSFSKSKIDLGLDAPVLMRVDDLTSFRSLRGD